jgi:hypothetical protein
MGGRVDFILLFREDVAFLIEKLNVNVSTRRRSMADASAHAPRDIKPVGGFKGTRAGDFSAGCVQGFYGQRRIRFAEKTAIGSASCDESQTGDNSGSFSETGYPAGKRM